MSASQTFSRSRPPLKKYRPCTVYMRSSITLAPPLHAAKAERVGGLGEEKRWRFSYPNSPDLKKSVTPSSMTDQQYHPCTPITRRKDRKREGLGERETLALLRGRRFGCPNSPEAREIKHTLKYDRLKLPTTFFTDKYGQVRTQTDICEKKIKHLDKLLIWHLLRFMPIYSLPDLCMQNQVDAYFQIEK